MNLKTQLSKRIGMNQVRQLLLHIGGDEKSIKELYGLIFEEDVTTSFQALWVCTHLNEQDNRLLFDKQNQLIDLVMNSTHTGKRRILLNVLCRQPVPEEFRTDFLDFCLERMMSKQELPATQMLCMKLAYEMCRHIPELLQEYRNLIEIMEPDLLSPAVRAVRRNIYKAITKKRGILKQ